MIEGNLAKDAVLPGKQKPAEVWLNSLAPGRGCKTRTIPLASIRKDLLEENKAREPLRGDFTTTAVCLTICLPTLSYGFTLGDKCEVQGTDTPTTSGAPNYQ